MGRVLRVAERNAVRVSRDGDTLGCGHRAMGGWVVGVASYCVVRVAYPPPYVGGYGRKVENGGYRGQNECIADLRLTFVRVCPHKSNLEGVAGGGAGNYFYERKWARAVRLSYAESFAKCTKRPAPCGTGPVMRYSTCIATGKCRTHGDAKCSKFVKTAFREWLLL
jgi:hypothetical protein